MEDRTLTTRVILVRHGQSSYNVERRVQGHCDESTLTADGQETARQVGVALNGLNFDALYSSPLQRAKDTADIIVSCLTESTHPGQLTLTDKLKEINLVQWEAMLFTEVEAKYPEGFRQWNEEPHKLCMSMPGPDGPTDFYPVPALFDQARQFWQEVLPQHPGQTILVVAHSGINRSLIATAIGLGPESYQAIQQHNCAISVLNFADQPVSGKGPIPPVQLESMNLTSHLGDPLPKRRHNAKGTRFLLVRHGETEWNRQKRFQGQIDVPLNDNGRQQAAQAGEFLKDVAIDYAVSSPMLRPKETAEIILKHHPQVELELMSEYCEISHGLWEGKFEHEIEAEYPGLLQQWQQAPETVQMPDGENLQQVWERAIAGWDAMVQSIAARQTDRPSTVLVVAHDAVNKALLCYVLGLGPDHFWNFRQGNGAVSVIDYTGGPDSMPTLQAMNITTHLAGGILDKTAAGAL